MPRPVIIMTNDRLIAKAVLTISTDRLQDSSWRTVDKGVNCMSCDWRSVFCIVIETCHEEEKERSENDREQEDL